jgi:CRP-like cAMP-binding protein
MMLPEEMTKIEFLKKLGEPYLNQIATLARLEECPVGTLLFEEGCSSPYFYLVLSGEVGLSVREPHDEHFEVAKAGRGEILGWSPALGRNIMTATARARTVCRLGILDAKQVLDLCEQDPRFGVAFLREIAAVLSSRLSSTRRRLAHVLRHSSVVADVVEGSD